MMLKRLFQLSPAAVALLLCTVPGAAAASLPLTLTFEKGQTENRLDLADLPGDLPRDWSGYEALVMEVKASSTQRVYLRVHTADGASRVLFFPYANVWIRAAIPVEMLAAPPKTGHDMASVGNRSRTGYYLRLWGPFVPLKDVEALSFEITYPVGTPTLEIRSVELARTSPGDAVLEGLPVVDPLGQYVHDSNEPAALEELKTAWEEEEKGLAPGDFGYCPYGGYEATKAEGTGFFRVEQRDGRWWFVDPDGHLFLSAGCDVMRPHMSTPVEGREELFSELPPEELRPPRWGSRPPGASFFTWNLFRRFGEDWMDRWIDTTFRRMEAWGLNTVANWSDPQLWDAGRKPYAIPLQSWIEGTHYLGLPDVYAEEWEQVVDERAREQCAPRRDDPWLLGYFLANEPPFPQKELQTVDLILGGPDTATKRELERWLAEGDTEERRKDFVDQAFDRYVQVTSAAVKKHDPNHLNLGMRGGGQPTEAEIVAARAFDVYSVNIYRYEVPAERVQEIARLTGKPIVIGEFHFGAPGRGLEAGLVEVRDQEQRGVAYRYYVEQAFSMPELIGTHYFQWADQPCTGRGDGEAGNIGLVDVTDRPYPLLIEALKATHSRLHDVHAGKVPPFDQEAARN
jgi:hypothetical protein